MNNDRLWLPAFALVILLIVSWLWRTTPSHPELLPRPAPAAKQGQFIGKFELVPLFGAGHRPVIRNGHQFYAERNDIVFRAGFGDLVMVYAGSTTDLASIPRFVWPILPPDGPWAEAAAIHDACYRSRGSFEWRGKAGRTRATPYTRAECDGLLDDAMMTLYVPPWKRFVIYWAVRAGGAAGWGH